MTKTMEEVTAANEVRREYKTREEVLYMVALGLALGGIRPGPATSRWGVAYGDALEILNNFPVRWWLTEAGHKSYEPFWKAYGEMGWRYDDVTGFITEIDG